VWPSDEPEDFWFHLAYLVTFVRVATIGKMVRSFWSLMHVSFGNFEGDCRMRSRTS
jgi:hypothetical protein